MIYLSVSVHMLYTGGKHEHYARSKIPAAADGNDCSCDVIFQLSSSDIIQEYRCIDVITGE